MAKNRTRSPDARIRFVTDLALALHGCDAGAARLEDTVGRAGRALGLQVDCFASPTALFVGVGDAPPRMLRVRPADFDAEALAALDRIATDVEAGLGVRAAGRRLGALKKRPAPGPGTVLSGFGVSAAGAAVLFGAALPEAAIAGGLGVLTAAVLRVVGQRPAAGRLAALFAAALVALTAGAAGVWVPITPERVTIAALIVVLPGLSLTLALADLAEGHLVAGTARLAAVGTTFLQLGLGAALGWSLFGGAVAGPPPPLWLHAAALVLAPPALGVLLRVRRQDLPSVMLASWAGVAVAQTVGAAAGPQAGAFAAALVVGLAGNGNARRGTPAPVVTVPGILLLVPGSVGFRGFAALLNDHTVEGIASAVTAVTVAACLAGGLLVAHAVLPERTTARP